MGRRKRLVALAVLAGLAGAPRLAQAQDRGGAPYSSMYANPYANPYTNPFLNPYMTQGPVQGNPALYLFAAQQASGGIGSGRISGTRPARSSAAPLKPETEQKRRATDVPGGSAASYFSRGSQPAGSSTAHYYNRAGRYYRSSTR